MVLRIAKLSPNLSIYWWNTLYIAGLLQMLIRTVPVGSAMTPNYLKPKTLQAFMTLEPQDRSDL